MTRPQQIVDTLFDQFPAQDLGGGPERFQFERLREVLSSASDWSSTLRRLYQAERCDEFALALMWLTDRLEADAVRTEALPDESEVFQRTLRRSLGLDESAFAAFEATTGVEPLTPEAVVESPAEALSSFGAEPIPEIPPSAEEPAIGSVVASADLPAVDGGPVPSTAMGEDDGTSDPEIYGRLLERFLESVQSGADDRAELLKRLRANNRAVQGDATASEEYQRYAAFLDDFLGYIMEHELLDDVRVMNLVANLQEPFSQWLAADEAGRAGILDQCVEMQRDFRTMFE
jgi:hypothetical protein